MTRIAIDRPMGALELEEGEIVLESPGVEGDEGRTVVRVAVGTLAAQRTVITRSCFEARRHVGVAAEAFRVIRELY